MIVILASLVAGDDTVLDVNHAVSILGDIVLVSYENDGIALALKTVEQSHDLHAGLGVEVASGFVGKDDRGLVHQSPGDGHALSLSTGKFVGLMLHAGFHAHSAERSPCTLHPFFGGDAGINQGEFDIVQRGRACQQVEGLEDESNFFVANAGEFVIVEFADLLPIQPVLALRRSIQTADQVHEGRFARA